MYTRVFFASIFILALVACGGGSGTGNGTDGTDDGGADTAGTDDGTDDGGQPPAPTLDQEHDPGPNPTLNLTIGAADCAQTFQAGFDGTLDSVELLLSIPTVAATGMMRVDVRATTTLIPNEDDGAVLGSVDLDVSTLPVTPTFVSFDLSSFNISVTGGEVYAIVARRISGDATLAGIHGSNSDAYPPGAVHRRPNPGVWSPPSGGDFGFRTIVTPNE